MTALDRQPAVQRAPFALEAEGWGDLHPTLRQMTRENRWLEMRALITDDICERLAVVGEPPEQTLTASRGSA